MLNFTYLTLFASFAGINQQVQRVRFYLLNSNWLKPNEFPRKHTMLIDRIIIRY